ncbi:MAG: hypothetical protein J6A23_10200 [Thermoguttaceae bacterium]|nr:hypothetical protein [Thermoguttaceae bacterium]MBP3695629.1 hypothetical protein [Thermoguttaceae bacterium]
MADSFDSIRLKKFTLRAEGYLELEMPAHALGEIRHASELRLQFTPHLFYLEGYALFHLKKYRDALYPLGQAVLLEPSEISYWLLIGMCQKRVGRCDLAIESLENALSIQPNNTVVLYNLACYYALAKQTGPCIQSLSRCLSLDPSFRDLVEQETDFNQIREKEEFCRIMQKSDERLKKGVLPFSPQSSPAKLPVSDKHGF